MVARRTGLGFAFTFAAYFRSRETHQGMDPASEQVLARVDDIFEDFARP